MFGDWLSSFTADHSLDSVQNLKTLYHHGPLIGTAQDMKEKYDLTKWKSYRVASRFHQLV